jgi:hypothetical protein
MFIERDLVRLVMQLNPYAPPPTPYPVMILANPNAGAIAARDADVAKANTVAQLNLVPPNFGVFEFETQDNPAYQMDWRWVFKGQERIVRRALRFKYRYPVRTGAGALATDYLLIGYEGGGGP